MKYFSIGELCRSNIADSRGIQNHPNTFQKMNLEKLIVRVLDPIRSLYGKPIYVNSGFRSATLNETVGGAKNSQHCFDDKTEILTTEGWRLIKDVKVNDVIYSYSIDKECIEIVPVDEIISYPYKGELIHIHNANLDVCVTDGHRMLIRYEAHKYKRKNTKNITTKWQAYFDSLKTDNDKFHIELAKDVYGKRRIYLCASQFKGALFSGVDIDFFKLCISVITDGSFTYQRGVLSGFRFSLKKERKIIHLCSLLEKMGIRYTLNIRKNDGATVIWVSSKIARAVFNVIEKEKNLPMIITLLSSTVQKELLLEYAFYDGSHDNRNGCNTFSISTTNKHNRDVLQSMGVLSGMRTTITIKPSSIYNIRGKEGVSKEAYIIGFHKTTSEVKLRESSYEKVDYDGYVWCANNRNTTLITRRNGKVSIQGNCEGKAADITTGNPKENKKLWDTILFLFQEGDIDFDQLINEKPVNENPSWIHISYNEDNNRGQILTLR